MEKVRPIGGFFELETSNAGPGPHPLAIGMSTGRGCLIAIIEKLRPKLVHVPFHICDTALEPFRKLCIPTNFYSIKPDLSPGPIPALKQNEFILWVNYYGVCGHATDQLKARYGSRLIIDDTHAFFHGKHVEQYSFTSARKYFGVPDGAYLFSPETLEVTAPRFRGASLIHSTLRTMGLFDEAYTAYTAYENSLPCEKFRISKVSQLLLRSINFHEIQQLRLRNYYWLDSILAKSNTLLLTPAPSDVPFCYPYLPEKPISRHRLKNANLFIPTLWPDVTKRPVKGYDTERKISTDLLPLPIDHRCSLSDLKRLVDNLRSDL